VHQAGLLAQSLFLTFPLLQWSEEETDSASGLIFTATGIAPGYEFCN